MEKATAVPSANASVVQIEIRQAAVARKFLGMFENVANTTNCVNQRSRGVMIHFAAQTINMNIDDIGCGVNPHLPHMVQNHGPGHDSTFVPAKILQQRKLLWSQLQQVITTSCFATYQIKLQVSSLQTHRFILWNRGSAQKISQPRQQFREGEWLREVIVSALLQSPDTLIHGSPSRQN